MKRLHQDDDSDSSSSDIEDDRHVSNEITVSSDEESEECEEQSDDDTMDIQEKEEEEEEDHDDDDDKKEEEEEEPAFEIVEDVHRRDEYAEFYEKAKKKLEKRKKRKRERDTKSLGKLHLIEESSHDSSSSPSSSITTTTANSGLEEKEEDVTPPVKVVKPFDYSQLRKMEKSRGVIYVMKPSSRMLQNERQVREYFSEFGSITRLQSHTTRRGKWVSGFYIEFEDREIAERVAMSINNTPISAKNSSLLLVKFMPDFQWSHQASQDERTQMYKKLMRAEAEKELRAIRSYKKNKKLSDQIKKNKIKKPMKRFKIAQRRAKTGGDEGSDIHLDLLPVFGERGSKGSNSKK